MLRTDKNWQKNTLVWMLALISFVIFDVANAQQAAPIIDGNYQIQGSNSQYGEYFGQGWVHGQQVQRLIQWKSYGYQGKKIQSIWTGSVTGSSLQFSLKLANVLTSFNGFTPSDEDLKTPQVITSTATGNGISFSVKGEGLYNEQWQRLGDASATPLWTDLRVAVDGTGDQGSLLIKLAEWAGIRQVIAWYRSQPQAQVYKDRPEFKNATQSFVQDHTDADFYAKNPDTLRITNKTLNPLSLAEAIMRHNAYASSLAGKAAYFENQTTSENLNAAGLLELSVLNESMIKVGRTPDYDAGLWTGMYGWAELMRYQTTHDPQALAQFRKVLDGMLTLVEITGDPHEFARTLAISPASENLGDGWVQGKGPYAALKWRQGGNNDMIKGVFTILALAHEVVGPQERELRSRIQNVSHALLGLTAVSSRSFNTGLAHGLLAIWNEDSTELQAFNKTLLNLETQVGDLSKVEAGIYAGGIADWSGVQLSMVSNLCQIIEGRELQKVFKNTNLEYVATENLKSAESRMLAMQKAYQKAHRDFLTIMTYAFSPAANSSNAFQAQAREALWTLREIPAPRSIGKGSIDLTKNPDWSLSAWPVVPWKALKTVRKMKPDLKFSDYAQGAYSYPNFETLAWSSTYIWKDAPFYLNYESNPQIRSFSSDYLLVYWAARSSGLISDKE